MTRVIRPIALGLTIAMAVGCGGGGDGGTTNPPPPPPSSGSFSLAISGAPLTIARITSGSVTVQVTRSNNFSADILLTASGLPAGVTAGFNAATVVVGAQSSALTLTASAAAAPGTYTITVTGTSTGATTQMATFQLTVTAPPANTGPFTLSMTATSHLIHPNNILFVFPKVNIIRNPGFTGPITFSVSGLPSSLTIGFTPNNTTANSVNAIPLSTGAATGTYTATIRGASSQGDQTITFTIVVASPTTGAIKWKFCSSSSPRVFFAVKDGNGPWTRIMPSGVDTSYSFTLASGAGHVAETTYDAGGYRTTIYSFSSTEMAARASAQCDLYKNVTTRTVNGSFGGVTGFRVSHVGMGWWFGSANGNGTFSLQNLPAGPLDVVAVRNGAGTDISQLDVDRMIIRRGVNPSSGSTLPVLDFSATESFAPVTATWTFANTVGDNFSMSQNFTTTGGTNGYFTIQPQPDGASVLRTIYGVPLAQMVNNDLHQIVATVDVNGPTPTSPARAKRQIVTYARTIANRTLSFGPAMPSPTVLPISTAPGRLRAQGTIPQEYNTGVTLDFTQVLTSVVSNSFTIHASRAFLGAGFQSYDLSIPDISAAIGWDKQFEFVPGTPVQWWASGGGPTLDMFDARYLFSSIRSRWTGITTGITAPVDGATYLFARSTGAVTP